MFKSSKSQDVGLDSSRFVVPTIQNEENFAFLNILVFLTHSQVQQTITGIIMKFFTFAKKKKQLCPDKLVQCLVQFRLIKASY